MGLYFSKTLRRTQETLGSLQGTVLSRRGNKLTICGKGMRPFGVWEEGHNKVTITLEEERIITPQPRGIVIHGVMEVKSNGLFKAH